MGREDRREPQPGEEVEPNDEPESVSQRHLRYAQWRTLAERNPLGEGRVVRAITSKEDPDTFAVAPREPGDVPEILVLAPGPGLALEVQAWAPDAEDLGKDRLKDRQRFQRAGASAPGELLLVRLPGTPRAGEPVLARVRAAEGNGAYQVLALGQGSASGPAALRLLDELAREGRGYQALVLAAEFARHLPGSSAKGEVLLAAGKLAEQLAAAGTPDPAVAQRVSQLLGEPLYDTAAGRPRYAGAFEALVQGEGRVAEEASLRLVTRARPCGPTEVARRAAFFLQRFPEAERADEARLLEARAEEEGYWRGGGKDAEALRRAVAAYGRAAAAPSPEASAEGKRALKRLSGKRPQRPAKAIQVCR
jgi:hypothetical protein